MPDRSPMTTLCYIRQNDSYLLLHRIKKKEDVNQGKWIGVGGHFEDGESPEECLLREVYEETGLTLTSYRFRGLVTFSSDEWPTEYMCLYTADGFTGSLKECNEGVLEWVPARDLFTRPMWEGDKIFFRLIDLDRPFFSLKLSYEGNRIVRAVLDGKELELFDLLDEKGEPTGLTGERSVVHETGAWHRTVHIWLVRKQEGRTQVLLQKRALTKDSFPGCYDISSAGHVQAGFGYDESAERELFEELGIRASDYPLTPVFLHRGESREMFYERPFINREVSQVYTCFCGLDESAYILQPEEVDSVLWVDFEQLLSDLHTGKLENCLLEDELTELKNYLN